MLVSVKIYIKCIYELNINKILIILKINKIVKFLRYFSQQNAYFVIGNHIS